MRIDCPPPSPRPHLFAPPYVKSARVTDDTKAAAGAAPANGSVLNDVTICRRMKTRIFVGLSLSVCRPVAALSANFISLLSSWTDKWLRFCSEYKRRDSVSREKLTSDLCFGPDGHQRWTQRGTFLLALKMCPNTSDINDRNQRTLAVSNTC